MSSHRSIRRRPPAWTLLFALGLPALLVGCEQRSASDQAAAPAAVTQDPVQRGQYLVTICGCNDCHTPWKMGAQGPEPDMSVMLSGHPASEQVPAVAGAMLISPTFTGFSGPFGTSYAANLTPHPTGIGNITRDLFIQAMRTGKHFGTGRSILPPMPWMWYGKMTDEDLSAVWAYLQTVPPIENAVPEPLPASAPAAN